MAAATRADAIPTEAISENRPITEKGQTAVGETSAAEATALAYLKNSIRARLVAKRAVT